MRLFTACECVYPLVQYGKIQGTIVRYEGHHVLVRDRSRPVLTFSLSMLSGGGRPGERRCEQSLWHSARRSGMMAHMYPPTVGWQATGAGGALPEEWQALMAA